MFQGKKCGARKTLRKTNKIKSLVALFAIILILPIYNVSAMHIMEGYLPIGWSIGWGVVCIPFLIMGGISINKQMQKNSKIKILLAMCGAFVFVLSSLKLPSVTGSCSHPTGTGLGAILFGPSVMAILGIIVLIFQAILLAHGGLTTLGANTFSMAIAGPFVAYGIFALLKKTKMPTAITVFIAATLGDLFTYCVTATQLAFAFPSAEGGFMISFIKFMGIFAATQVPIAIAEGILTVIVFNILEKNCKEELSELKVALNGGAL